jgi:hypothetical protein
MLQEAGIEYAPESIDSFRCDPCGVEYAITTGHPGCATRPGASGCHPCGMESSARYFRGMLLPVILA